MSKNMDVYVYAAGLDKKVRYNQRSKFVRQNLIIIPMNQLSFPRTLDRKIAPEHQRWEF